MTPTNAAAAAATERRRSSDRSVISVRTLVVASLIVLALVLGFAFLARIFDLVLLVLIAVVFAEGIHPLVQYF